MRLDEQYRNCIVLIGTGSSKSDDEISPWGTGFIVSDSETRTKYLVTAAHVVSDKDDTPFDVRFNKKGGGAQNVRVAPPNWVYHPTDNTVDVAVHPIDLPEWAACTSVPKSPNLSEDNRFASKNIGAGNRTYTVGLWKFMHGDKRNQPFVYSGHIGLVPEDQRMPVKRWFNSHSKNQPVLAEVYLVEGEPLDGASGSPVFVRRTLPGRFQTTSGSAIEGAVEGSIWLLGLLSDAFQAKPGRDYTRAIDGGPTTVPRGVNVVVPADKIMDVFGHPDLVAFQLAAEQRAITEKLAEKSGSDVDPKPPTTDENPNGKEDFGSLLGAAVRTPQQDN